MSYELPHSETNSRNSEGSFVTLKDGRLMFAYTKYEGNGHFDHCSANIVAIYSRDNGETWGDERVLVKNKALNVMSVSLLRLQDGRIAMLYLEKSDFSFLFKDRGYTNIDLKTNTFATAQCIDCRPWFTTSSDEGITWSPAIDVTRLGFAYIVVNNDRMIQLKSGRLVIPCALHTDCGNGQYRGASLAFFCYSDDGGVTWTNTRHTCNPPQHLRVGFQEPGAIELSDGRLQAYFRTSDGYQYKAFSSDQGESWSAGELAKEFPSPTAPLSMKRYPKTGDLYAVWCDIDPRWHIKPDPVLSWGRTPLVIARSTDEGQTWQDHTILEDKPDHGYCYTAMHFVEDGLLLAYCCGGGENCNVLQDLRIRKITL